MNYLNKTEKLLKSCLKEKVKITTATIVGFLIAGTVAFGATSDLLTIYKVVNGNEYGKNVTAGEEIAWKGTGTNRAETSAVVFAKGGEIGLNEGKIYITTAENGFLEGMTGKYGEEVELVNKGEIHVEDGDRWHIAGMGANPGVTAKNEGKIFVKDGAGMRVNPGSGTIINETTGNIEVTGNGVGMLVLAEENGTTATNKGNIKVTQNSVNPLENNNSIERWGRTGVLIETDKAPKSEVKAGEEGKDTVVSFINEKNATITAPLGVEYDGYNNGAFKGKVAIKNDGDIEVNDYLITKYNNSGWVRNGGIYSASSSTQQQGEVINNGNITMTLSKEQGAELAKLDYNNTNANNLHALRLHENTYGENNGVITVKYDGEQAVPGIAAVAVTGGADGKVSTTFINNNEINVSGNGVHGIYARNKGQGEDILTVTNNGKIVVNGKEAVGIYVDAGESGAKGTATITNEKDGKILVGSGATAISINEKNGFKADVSNNGLISLADTTVDLTKNADADTTVSTLLAGNGGELVNYGSIALEDRTSLTDKEWDFVLSNIVKGGTLTNYGMIVDKEGNSLLAGGEEISGEITVEDLNKGSAFDNGIEVVEGGATIKGNTNEDGTTMVLETPTINVTGGDLTLAQGENNAGVAIDTNTINVATGKKIKTETKGHSINGDIILNGNSNIYIKANGGMTLTGNVSQGQGEGAFINNNGELILSDANIGVDITNENGSGILLTNGNTNINNVAAKDLTINPGVTTFNGTIDVGTITIENKGIMPLAKGENEKTSTGYFGSNSSFVKANGTDITITENGKAVFEIGNKGENALSNSTGKVTIEGNVDVDYSGLVKDMDINLDKNLNGEHHNLDGINYTGNNDGVYKVYLDKDDKDNNVLSLEYNQEYLAEYGSEINDINNGFQIINDKVTAKVGESKEARANLADKVYAGTIYSETMKVAYNNTKLIEDNILSLDTENKVGEWTANGKTIYNKTEYDRDGKISEYSTDVDTVGLMATAEYGVNETASVGITFAGATQDVDTDTGSADGDAFYLGVFGNKTIGNSKLTAGLGYQFDKFDSDEEIFGGSESYDTNAFSAYIQGKHSFDLGDNLSFEPKLKLGYTYVEQDSIEDGTYKMDSQDMSIFDAEVGADIVKTVALESGKLDLVFGASYVRAMGDTDDEYSAKFYSAEGEGKSFDILGAELSENTGKFNFDVKVTKDNGLFYNGGVTLRVGSDNTRDYGVNVGVGYRF